MENPLFNFFFSPPQARVVDEKMSMRSSNSMPSYFVNHNHYSEKGEVSVITLHVLMKHKSL